MASHTGWLLAWIPRLRVLVVALVWAALVGMECGGAGVRPLESANVKTCGAINSKFCRRFTAAVLVVGVFCRARHR